jgi:hypothetical protein
MKIKRFLLRILRRLITFILFSCVLFDPVVGTYTWFQYKKRMIKQEVQEQIKAGIDQSELVLLQFSKKDIRTKLRWEHAREFEYNHRMYDIVETKTAGDTVYYWCWYDHMETMLNLKMEELASQKLKNSGKSKSEQAFLASSLKSLYCTFAFNLNISIVKSLIKPSDKFSQSYSQIRIQPPTPPPQFI